MSKKVASTIEEDLLDENASTSKKPRVQIEQIEGESSKNAKRISIIVGEADQSQFHVVVDEETGEEFYVKEIKNGIEFDSLIDGVVRSFTIKLGSKNATTSEERVYIETNIKKGTKSLIFKKDYASNAIEASPVFEYFRTNFKGGYGKAVQDSLSKYAFTRYYYFDPIELRSTLKR